VAKSRRTDADEPRRRRPEDDDDKPRRGARDDADEDEEDDAPQKPRKKKVANKGPARTIFTILGSVAGAAALILLLYWIYSPMGTDHRMLCYVPPEATSLMGYDVHDNAINPKMKEVHDLFLNNYKRFSERRFVAACGVTDKDVERYLSGHASGDPKEEEKEPDAQNKRGDFTIIRFKQDLDKKKFVDSFTNEYQCEEVPAPDGKTFYRLYRVAPNERVPDISFFFPNDRTLMYTSTRRELTEALKRQPGKIELEGAMRDLAEKVDGQYFSAQTMSTVVVTNAFSPRFAFSGGFLDKDVREVMISTGSATWFASNGNDFLYANGELYADKEMARKARAGLVEGYAEARKSAYGDGGKPSGTDEIFFTKAPTAGGFGGDGNKEAKQAAATKALNFLSHP